MLGDDKVSSQAQTTESLTNLQAFSLCNQLLKYVYVGQACSCNEQHASLQIQLFWSVTLQLFEPYTLCLHCNLLAPCLTLKEWRWLKKAGGAVQRALASGKKRQRLQLLLPVDQRQFNYLDTEPRSKFEVHPLAHDIVKLQIIIKQYRFV